MTSSAGRSPLERARRRPVLYMLVYGAFLVVIGITATAQAVLASTSFTSSVLNAVVASDRSIIGAFVSTQLRPSDVDADGPSAARREELQQGISELLPLTEVGDTSRIIHVELRDPEGKVLLGDRSERFGMSVTSDDQALAVGSGHAVPRLATGDEAAASFGSGLPENVLTEYLPITSADGSTVMAVLAVARDADQIVAQLERSRTDIVLLTLAAAGLITVLLFFVFRAAQSRISRQTEQLVDAARRDSLTGLLNHGSISEVLASTVAEAKGKSRVGIALIDVDNFTLLNQTHGHRAGDETLKRIADLLREQLSEQYRVGRFGPDEFLVVAPPLVVNALEKAIGRLRTSLKELTLQFDDTERLPVTISAGLAIHPDHAPSVTDLVSTVALTLNEAKSSGGDQVRMTDRTADERADARGFDVLRGLVIAVDTKDRYTKRHSEDVARYASFIARRMELGDQFESTIRLAGLLHDVGKIGIPDQILRKPGRLTEVESDIVKQHVALGDAIVRDLPNIEAIRAGIRHHHERWDGTGYLDGLGEEEIPIIARILSVADVFSAMTTTRPYRKALPLTEALKRLGDAAGSQLDEELVKIFITGIETAPDAPLPGTDVPPGQLWVPSGASLSGLVPG